LDVKNGYSIAQEQINKLKQLCDNHLFNCDDIHELEFLMKEKIKFSSEILELSTSGKADSAITILKGSKDSLLITRFINKYNAIYERGKLN
jgi:hypothetical protein